MISARQAYLLRYWENVCCPSPTTPLRSAIASGLLNCLSLEETIQLIFADIPVDPRLREKILTRLIDEAGRAPREVYDSVVQQLLDTIADTPHPRKTTVAYCLERLYDSVSCTARRAIIHAFLQSPQHGLRRRAYKLLWRNWHAEWASEVHHCWEQWHESECTRVIVDHFDVAFLVQHIERLAGDLNDGAYVARLYLRACAVDAGLLTQLRKRDGITYAYVSARLSNSVPKRVASQLLRQYQQDARLNILAWSLGRLGYWELVVKLSADVATLEEEIRRRDLERWGIRG